MDAWQDSQEEPEASTSSKAKQAPGEAPRLIWTRGTSELAPVIRGPPREDYAKELSGPAINDKPFATSVRHVRCSRCRGPGHESVDRICPLFNKEAGGTSTLPSDILRAARREKREGKRPPSPKEPPPLKEEPDPDLEVESDDDEELKEQKLRLRILSRLTAKAAPIKTEPEPSKVPKLEADVVTLDEEEPRFVPSMNYCQLQSDMAKEHSLKLKSSALQELCVTRSVQRMGTLPSGQTQSTDPEAVATASLLPCLDERQFSRLSGGLPS